jgi:argininosuccinate lyase
MTGKPWDGRFEGETDRRVEAFTSSISIDSRLYRYDIQGSAAHCRMLARCGIVSEKDAEKLVEGLEKVRGEIERGEFVYDDRLEDIHMHIEDRLRQIVGGLQAAHGPEPQRPGGPGPAAVPAGCHRPHTAPAAQGAFMLR